MNNWMHHSLLLVLLWLCPASSSQLLLLRWLLLLTHLLPKQLATRLAHECCAQHEGEVPGIAQRCGHHHMPPQPRRWPHQHQQQAAQQQASTHTVTAEAAAAAGRCSWVVCHTTRSLCVCAGNRPHAAALMTPAAGNWQNRHVLCVLAAACQVIMQPSNN